MVKILHLGIFSLETILLCPVCCLELFQYLVKSVRNDKVKCLHLLYCLEEIMLTTMQNVFQNGIVDLSHQMISPNDVRTLIPLLMRSNKMWTKLDLSHCELDVNFCYTLWEMYTVQNKNLNIKTIDISNNDNLHWESVRLICELLKYLEY